MRVLIAGVYVELNASSSEQAALILLRRFAHVIPPEDLYATLWLTSLVDNYAEFYRLVGFFPPSEIRTRAYRHYSLIHRIALVEQAVSNNTHHA